jgi:hypothetical protein
VKPPRAETLEGELAWGDLLLVRADVDEFCEVDVKPVRGVDVGEGLSRPLSRKCRGGQVGVALDARGRPILFPSDQAERRRIVSRWLDAMDLYPSKGSGGT